MILINLWKFFESNSDTIIDKGIPLLNNMRMVINRKEELKYDEYIEKVFNNTMIIHQNYIDMLNIARSIFEKKEMNFDQICNYFSQERIKQFYLRSEVRNLVKMDYYQNDELKENFSRGVLGILQGGLKSPDLPSYVNNDYKYKNHTILDLLKRIKEDEDIDISNVDLVNEKLYLYINELEIELYNAWNLVSNSYYKLKVQHLKI